MNTMLGFWAVAMRLVFCASSGDKDNPRTAPMAARARVIFSIRFVMSVIPFCKAQFDSRKQVEFKKADTEKRRLEGQKLPWGRAVLIYFSACPNSITLPNNPGRPCRPRRLSERYLSLEREQL